MRTTLAAFAALLALVTDAPAQTPPPPPPPGVLAKHLAAWEAKMRDVNLLSAVITRVDTDKVFKATTKLSGYALYMKSGAAGAVPLNKARLELTPDGKKEPSEKIISTGTFLYLYVPSRKEIQQHPIEKPKEGGALDDNFLGLVFGMKAKDAMDRYELTLHKEDAHYVYVNVLPKRPADKAEFKQARLVLNKTNYLPRQLWFEAPNGNETLWDLPRAEVPTRIDPRYFDAPRPDPGWKLVPVAGGPAAPPRVIRPSAGK